MKLHTSKEDTLTMFTGGTPPNNGGGQKLRGTAHTGQTTMPCWSHLLEAEAIENPRRRKGIGDEMDGG